jgi:arylsulfatase A-like enzyme
MPPDLAELGGTAPQHLAGYCGQIKRIDEAFGRLLEALKSLGLSENTVVVFASDHGNHFKTRNDEYKRSPHESSIRVPIVILGPGFEDGGRVEQLVSLLDLPPTLLEAAGLPIPDEKHGRSVLPLLSGEREGWPEGVLVQISESQVGRAIRTRRWKYCVVAPEADPKDDSSAEHYVEDGLYDLKTDPYELHNLAGLRSHRDIVNELKQHLISRMIDIDEPKPIVEPPWSGP